MASKARRTYVCGIGTSWHAALVGEHLFRSVGHHDAHAWHSFEFASYPPPLSGEDLVIVMAHSGTKHYSAEALSMAKESGAMTAILTCQTSEARLELADVVLKTTYRDRSSAFTVSHTGAMTALALIASRLPGGEETGRELAGLPDKLASALKREAEVMELVAQVREFGWYCFAGWGPNASTAYEAALKINEATYDVTTAFQLEQFLHGPFVATGAAMLGDAGFPARTRIREVTGDRPSGEGDRGRSGGSGGRGGRGDVGAVGPRGGVAKRE